MLAVKHRLRDTTYGFYIVFLNSSSFPSLCGPHAVAHILSAYLQGYRPTLEAHRQSERSGRPAECLGLPFSILI